MNLQVRWQRNAYAIVDTDENAPQGRIVVRDNMWERGWARVDEDFDGNADAYVLDRHKNAIIAYLQSGWTLYREAQPNDGVATSPAKRDEQETRDRTFTVNVHLGKGTDGARRLYALRSLAAQAGYYWNGEPSIGRWLSALADNHLGRDWQRRSDTDLRVTVRTLAQEQIEMWQGLLETLQ